MSARAHLQDVDIRQDLFAGLTVALVGLPQCLAYAMMSGLPPAYGLSTAAVAGFVAAVAGKSAGVVTGPTNTTGLLVLAALTPFLGDNGLLTAAGLSMLASLTLLAGLLRVFGAQLGAAQLLRFLPESVLTGFTAGAGLLIGIMQLDEALGLKPLSSPTAWAQLTAIITRLAESGATPNAVIIAGLTVALIAGARRIRNKRIPVPLLILVASILLGAFGPGLGFALPIVADRASVSTGWPPGAMPSLDPKVYLDLMVPTLAIILLGTLELAVSARADGAHPDMKRELVAQGAGNVAGAFLSGFPASASLTRSALLRLGGAQTRLAAASAALFVVPILLFGGRFVGFIPESCLAGVLLITAFGMVNPGRLREVWVASGASRLLLMVTLIATLTLPLVWAILIGSGLAVLIELSRTSEPRLVRLAASAEGTRLEPVGEGDAPEVIVIEVSGSLFYASAYALPDLVLKAVPAHCLGVVLDLSHAHRTRYAAAQALARLADELSARNQALALAGVPEETADMIERLALGIELNRFDPHPGRSALMACRQLREKLALASV